MRSPSPQLPRRFVGLDVHKQTIVVAAVDKEQQVLLRPRRFALAEFLNWATEHLGPSDAVVLEASTNTWPLYDQLQPVVASVTVAHSGKLEQAGGTRVKTDPRDTLHLARLLAAGLIPPVWVPPPEVRHLRTLIGHRRRLVEQRVRLRNHLHGILHAYNLPPPLGEPFAASHQPWWEQLPLPPAEHLRVRHLWSQLVSLNQLITEVEAELLQQSTVDPWAAQVPFLVQLPGIGVLTALLLLAAIGDIARFPTAKKLVGYSGLGASIRASGKTQRPGGIRKEGRREVRTAMVEAAWVAVERHPYWKVVFQRLSARLGKRKAIVAVARKLLVVVWHVLSEQVADRQADEGAVARKLFRWGTERGTAQRLGLSRAAFMRLQLTRLGLGEDLMTAPSGSQGGVIPPQDCSAETG